MAKTETIRARMEPSLKHEAEIIFSGLGLTPTDAISLFYKQVTLNRGLPFELKLPRVPNAETIAALEESHDPAKLNRYDSVDDLMQQFEK